MNPSTILGMAIGVALLVLTVVFDPSTLAPVPGSEVYYNAAGIKSLAIVLVGTLAATFISYPLKEVVRVFRVFWIVFKKDDIQVGESVSQIVALARITASDGVQSLQGQIPRIKNLFMRDGIQMLVDNYTPENIRELMDVRITSRRAREDAEAAIFKTMAKFAPAFGMLGTLVGLIAMLRNMTGPNMMDTLGPSMAIALVTTFFGVILANLFFGPIATKLERRTEEEITLMNIVMEGVLLLRESHSPSIIEDKLKAYVPPAQWQTNKALSYSPQADKPPAQSTRRPALRQPTG